jgi:acyl transferase domain-containing protein/acyl carrier protein
MRSARDVEVWLFERLAERLGIPVSSIDAREPLASYGISSREAVVLSGELEEWLGRALSPTLLWEFPTIDALARHLSASETAGASAPPELAAGDGVASDAVAVVGIGCRFPGAPDPAAFWQLLRTGGDAIGEVPRDRWDVDAFFDRDPSAPGRMISRFGGFLSDVAGFEPSFFGVSPREAARIDPQQRLLLEVAWEALEHAGIAPDALRGTSTGVFVGISTSDYSLLQLSDPALVDAYAGTGNAHSIAANRLSYVLDLRGPSLAVDTACSSSLVAVHLARQSLRAGECRVALAGGVNLLLAPQLSIAFSKAGMMAPDGRCKTFDASADGYVRGEGCGVVVLKRLGDALADGDHVLGVLRGSAVNQDGLSNGLTAPNGQAQRAVIRDALASAGVPPEHVSYVEAHGTGTPLGDPIEVEALRDVLAPGRRADQGCALGSVKTNIGHLEAAAGIAGFIKTVLALSSGEIPPHLHLRTLNPHVDLGGTFVIPRALLPWPSSHRPRVAGVSAFGFGGTNVHVILEEPPAAPPRAPRAPGPDLLVLSARSERALGAMAARYAEHLETLAPDALGDACATSRRGRSHLVHRLAVTGDTGQQLAASLSAFAAGREPARVDRGRVRGKATPKVAFLFTGQGAQYGGMGRELYEAEPVFRRALERCDAALGSTLGIPLLSVLWPAPGEPARIDDTAYTQPALFALEYALTELWASVGVTPDAVLGHSVGEYAAACAAGVFSVEDGVRLVAERGRLMQATSDDGAMAALFTDEAEVAPAIAPYARDAAIASVNGPAETVVSGRRPAIERIVETFARRGVKARRLVVSHAFHSPLMDGILDRFAAAAEAVTYRAPGIPLVSNVSGEIATGELVGRAGYWREHLRAPVRFAAGVAALASAGCEAFVELGPGATLVSLAQRCLDAGGATWAASLRRGKRERGAWLEAVGTLYTRGVRVDWPGLDAGRRPRSLPLPTYPFERERCWFDAGAHARRPAAVEPPRASAELVPRPDGERLEPELYTVAWRAAPPLPATSPPGTGPVRWLVVADRGGVGSALGEALRDRGAECRVLDPDVPAAEIARAAAGSRGVAWLAGLDESSADDELASAQDTRCASALGLVHALLGAGAAAPLWLVTRHAQPVTGPRLVAVARAALWGFGRVLALEHPELWGGLIDVGGGDAGAAVAASIAQELLASDGEDQLAYRDGRRLVARLERLAHGAVGQAPAVVRADATYLVTGGLGGIGLAVAGWLVDRGARQLVLTGRGADRRSPAQASAVAELERRGARVRVAQVDATDPEAMAALLAELRLTAPPLRGVLHAAGVSAPRAIAELDGERLSATLAPKLAGAWNLHRLTRDLELDHFVCFSSVSSILGSRGLAAYAAANAALDALAHHRRNLGLAATTVNWGPWAEVGMASGDAAALRRIGMNPLPTSNALAILDRLLGGRVPQALVADVDWTVFAPALEARRRRPMLDAVRPAPGAATTATPSLRRRIEEVPPCEREDLLVASLQEEVARVLGRDAPGAVDVTQGLFEMGLDSLMAVELKARLEKALGFALPRTLVFEFPSIAVLSRHLLSLCAPRAAPPVPDATPTPSTPCDDPEAALLRELEALDAERNA